MNNNQNGEDEKVLNLLKEDYNKYCANNMHGSYIGFNGNTYQCETTAKAICWLDANDPICVAYNSNNKSNNKSNKKSNKKSNRRSYKLVI